MIHRLDPAHLYLFTGPDVVGFVRGDVIVQMSPLTTSLLRRDLIVFARAYTRDRLWHANITLAYAKDNIRIRDHTRKTELILTRAELACVCANLRSAIIRADALSESRSSLVNPVELN